MWKCGTRTTASEKNASFSPHLSTTSEGEISKFRRNTKNKCSDAYLLVVSLKSIDFKPLPSSSFTSPKEIAEKQTCKRT